MKRFLLLVIPFLCGIGHADGFLGEWPAPTQPSEPYHMHASELIFTPQGGGDGGYVEPIVEEAAAPPSAPPAVEQVPSIEANTSIPIGAVIPYATFANGRYYWTYKRRHASTAMHRSQSPSRKAPAHPRLKSARAGSSKTRD